MTPIDRVISQAREIGFEVVAELDPKTIVLREDVRAMCAEGKCHAYGKNWTCPPACGDLDECRSVVESYKEGVGIIVQTVGQLEDSMDYETMMDTGKIHGERFRRLAEKIREEYPSALCLGAGGCTVCKSCSYPQPCRFPEKAFSSMEAFGMLVSDVCTVLSRRKHHRVCCICQGKVDTQKHHSIKSPVRSCTELGFYSPKRPQVARDYSNEHTCQAALEHLQRLPGRSRGTILPLSSR